MLSSLRSTATATAIQDFDKLVALGHYAWHIKSTDREWESDSAHVFTVRDGRVTGFQEYTDTAALADAYREG
jgi:ketosteroid isomerase-like protein